MHADGELAVRPDLPLAALAPCRRREVADAHGEGAHEGAVERLHERRAPHLSRHRGYVAPRAQPAAGGGGALSSEKADGLDGNAGGEGDGRKGGEECGGVVRTRGVGWHALHPTKIDVL